MNKGSDIKFYIRQTTRGPTVEICKETPGGRCMTSPLKWRSTLERIKPENRFNSFEEAVAAWNKAVGGVKDNG